MTEITLQHDPRTKQQIKDMLIGSLYAPVRKRFNDRLENLVVRNTVLVGASHKSFIYKGKLYTVDSSPAPRKSNRLHPTLREEVEEYLKELRELETTELPYVQGFIIHALNSSNDFCDYFRIFPESLHGPLKKVVATCPCRAKKLEDEAVLEIRENNQKAISLIKERMVLNLLL